MAHDFKAVLELIEADDMVDRTLDQATDGNLDAIKAALHIANAFQKYEIEVQARMIHKEKIRLIGYRDNMNIGIQNLIDIEIRLKAMATQLIKECE